MTRVPRRRTRSPSRGTGEQGSSEWVSERPRRRSELARSRAALRRALKEGTLDKFREPALRPPEKVRFVFRRKRQCLVIEQDEKGWLLEWRRGKRRLGTFERISALDGTEWIVEPPQQQPAGGLTIPYPRRPHAGLASVVSGWRNILDAYGRPELAHEQPRSASIVQIQEALSEAVRREDAAADRFVDSLVRRARAYLQGLWFADTPRPTSRMGAEGLRPVATRPTALLALADHWSRYLPPDHKTGRVAASVAEEFIRSLRTGSSYATVAAELPKLATAGPAEVALITASYVTTCSTMLAQRLDLLCERCAPGEEGVGRDGAYYTAPIPGDTAGWGCKRGTSCADGESEIRETRSELGKKVVERAAVALGMPPGKARALFDFERVAQDRVDGKRPKASKPRKAG